MAALVTADFVELVFLDLAENDLDATAAEVLSRGDWPVLSTLCLTDNMLDDAAMQHLIHGDWDVQHVAIALNPLTAAGIGLMMSQAEWQLDCLELGAELVNAATWDLLGLDFDCMIGLNTRLRKVGQLLYPGRHLLKTHAYGACCRRSTSTIARHLAARMVNGSKRLMVQNMTVWPG